MASPGEQDAHTRHVGTAWRHKSDGSFIAGTVKAAHPDKDAASVNTEWMTASKNAAGLIVNFM